MPVEVTFVPTLPAEIIAVPYLKFKNILVDSQDTLEQLSVVGLGKAN